MEALVFWSIRTLKACRLISVYNMTVLTFRDILLSQASRLEGLRDLLTAGCTIFTATRRHAFYRVVGYSTRCIRNFQHMW
jgi:hypothetical protein